MITNIKVTATYEEETTSKFDELVKQYNVAKAIADETESTKQPLIDAMGEKKLELIYKQLETIVDHLKVLEKLHGGGVQEAKASNYMKNGFHCYTVKIRYCRKWNCATEIYLDGETVATDWWFDEKGIVTNWNKLKLYEQLEMSCERQIEELIKLKMNKTQEITNNYNNMINN